MKPFLLQLILAFLMPFSTGSAVEITGASVKIHLAEYTLIVKKKTFNSIYVVYFDIFPIIVKYKS